MSTDEAERHPELLMIDRPARIRMAEGIRSYLEENTTAFELDELLWEVMDSTEDHTLKAVGECMWFHYDDCTDHHVVATKEEWDCFQRLLLLLDSDAEMETKPGRLNWHPAQAVAAGVFALFLVVAFRVGFAERLFVYAIPFGPPSMLLSWLRSRRENRTATALDTALTPFPSVGGLLSVRRSVSGFTKLRYPGGIASRSIRSRFQARVMTFPSSVLWCLFSPLALLFQMIPEVDSEIRIVLPDSVPASS